MYTGDQARKKVLIDHGFRLPSAADNRPLKGEEFWEKARQTVFVSATPGNWEMEVSGGEVAEQDLPMGVLDPVVEVRPTGQVDDLLGEIRGRAAKDQRVLVTTLTKRMAEDLTDYWRRTRCVRYPHSRSTDRADRDYPRPSTGGIRRAGWCEPAAGGLGSAGGEPGGHPDADKEGFPGRAIPNPDYWLGGRHVEVALLYADNMTDSMAKAISETERRRAIQQTYNEKNGVVLTAAGKKANNSILSFLNRAES